MGELATSFINVVKQRPVIFCALSFGAGCVVGYFARKKLAEPSYEVHHVPRQEGWFERDWEPKIKETLKNHDLEMERERAILSEGDDIDARMFIERNREDTTIEVEERIDLGQNMIIHSQYEDGSEDIWDYEEEGQHRTEERPYALSRAEFFDNEKNYSQITLTYYSGDNKMADESDELVHNYQKVVGPLLFGHGSDDPRVFYVRNDKLKGEYEVLNHPGSYEVEIQGLEEENIQAAQFVRDVKRQRGRQKFKPDEEDE